MVPDSLQVSPENASNGHVDQSKFEVLLSRIAHDQKALLRHISIYAELSKDRDITQDARNQNLNKISGKVTALARLADCERLISMIERKAFERRDISLSKVINTQLRQSPHYREHGNWTLSGEASAKVDPQFLSFALREIFLNAAQHAQPDQPLEITLLDQPSATIRITTNAATKVEDRLFEPFETAQPNDKESTGSGLGLYAVRQIMTKHHGQATLESPAPGTFSVVLTFP